MKQLITPTPDIWCRPGWCLEYVRKTFGLPARYGTATAAWEASTARHRDLDFPAGVWVPLWFSLAGVPAGHVALRAPSGAVYSTSDLGNVPHRHPDLADLISYYARYNLQLRYLGWSEDVAGFPVVAPAGITAQGSTAQKDEDMALNADQDATLHSANIRADIARQEATNSKVIGLELLKAVAVLSAQVAAIGTPAAADRCADVDRIVTEIGQRLINDPEQ